MMISLQGCRFGGLLDALMEHRPPWGHVLTEFIGYRADERMPERDERAAALGRRNVAMCFAPMNARSASPTFTGKRAATFVSPPSCARAEVRRRSAGATARSTANKTSPVAEFDCEEDTAGAYLNLGFALQELGRDDEAVEAFETAVELDPELEERITGEELRSPSVQLRISPFGEVEVLSTHDQLLGGRSGQTYLGCRFPADFGYARAITSEATKVADQQELFQVPADCSEVFEVVHGLAAAGVLRGQAVIGIGPAVTYRFEDQGKRPPLSAPCGGADRTHPIRRGDGVRARPEG